MLEPGCGAGTFIGLAPDGARMTGVELDPVTAGIAAAVYPEATIRAESFATSRFPDGRFDAVIGNVPFADIKLHDPRHNRGQLMMHNHFIVKSLALTRPGGLVMVLTSRYTMDAQNPAGRRAMQELADLVGAVRLPTGAHRRAAGTEAVTDLLVFRRREPDRVPVPADRLGTHDDGRSAGPARCRAVAAEQLVAGPSRNGARRDAGRGRDARRDRADRRRGRPAPTRRLGCVPRSTMWWRMPGRPG